MNCKIHKTIKECQTSLNNIKDPFIKIQPDELFKESKCLFKTIKIQIIRLRRKLFKCQDWNYFKQNIETNVDYICENMNTRWLVSICDTYCDYGLDIEKSQAYAISLFVNLEKLNQTIITMHDCKIDNSTLEKMRYKTFPIWDGMTTMSMGKNADVIFNLFNRKKILFIPLFYKIFNTICLRMVDCNQTTLNVLNKYSTKSIINDMKIKV